MALTLTLTSATTSWPTPPPLLLLQLKPILHHYPEPLGLKKSPLPLPFLILSQSAGSWCLLFWEMGLINGVVVVVVLGSVGRWWWQWFWDLGLIVVVVVVFWDLGLIIGLWVCWRLVCLLDLWVWFAEDLGLSSWVVGFDLGVLDLLVLSSWFARDLSSLFLHSWC